jgi:signal transduction histidine kinase
MPVAPSPLRLPLVQPAGLALPAWAGRAGLAVATTALAALVALVFYPVFQAMPAAPFLAAIAVSARACGRSAGLLATALGALATGYVFFPRVFALSLPSPLAAARLSSVVLVALCIVWLMLRLRGAYEQAERGRQAAVQAARLQEVFLSIAAHELRTPVTTIKGYAQVLARQASQPSLDQTRLLDTSATLQRQIDRLERLVVDLLDIAHSSRAAWRWPPNPMIWSGWPGRC